jgi:hypothetical protein
MVRRKDIVRANKGPRTCGRLWHCPPNGRPAPLADNARLLLLAESQLVLEQGHDLRRKQLQRVEHLAVFDATIIKDEA